MITFHLKMEPQPELYAEDDSGFMTDKFWKITSATLYPPFKYGDALKYKNLFSFHHVNEPMSSENSTADEYDFTVKSVTPVQRNGLWYWEILGEK